MRSCFLLTLLTALPAAAQFSSDLKSRTVAEFEEYLRTAEATLEQRAKGARAFLLADEQQGGRESLRKGSVDVRALTGGSGKSVTDGVIHDWVGSMFLPGATVERVLAVLQDFDRYKEIYAPEVIDSKALGRDGDAHKLYLRLRKKKVLTVILNTEYRVRYSQLGPAKWEGRSQSTKITEVSDAGTDKEKELPPGTGHGFLWRINAYWRFEQTKDGVFAECQAISLTRDVPTGLGWIVRPIIRDLPKESLISTMEATRKRVAR